MTWTAPASGGPVTSYVVTPYIGSTAQTPTTINGTPPATTAKLDGLTPGTQYTFTVQASNPNGAGPSSSQSNAVSPEPEAAPRPRVRQRDCSVHVGAGHLDPSQRRRRQRDHGYTVTPVIGGQPQTPVQVGGDKTSAIVSGLSDGVSYTFKVTATNAIGSTDSAASAPVIPYDTVLDFGTPAMVDSGDTSQVVLGMKFTTSLEGTVTGVRFYKARPIRGPTSEVSGPAAAKSSHRLRSPTRPRRDGRRCCSASLFR